MARQPTVNDHAQANRAAITPRTPTQRAYIRSINDNPQTFVLGPAGTGKTFVAAAIAAGLYLRGKIDRIIITRPRVEVDEEWGHLPGSLAMKTAPWAYPITEVLEEFMGKARYQQAVKDAHVEVLPLAFMRGRTLERAFCILDEAQNTTVRQMQMFVTRIGEESRVVVNGDLAQKDIPNGSGLAWALRMLEIHSNLPAGLIEFGVDDVVRSDACGAWIKAMTETPDPNGVFSKVQDRPRLCACQ